MNPLTNAKNLQKLNLRELSLGLTNTATSWHAKYKDSAWIFAGGLPYELTEGDVICIFSQYGEIVNVNLVRDKDTGKSRGFAFICYEDQRSTILAVDNFNTTKILNRPIRVDHVEDYRVPKEYKDADPLTTALHKEGCAPVPVQLQGSEEAPEKRPKAVKKEKDKKKKKKNKVKEEPVLDDANSVEKKKKKKKHRDHTKIKLEGASNETKIKLEAAETLHDDVSSHNPEPSNYGTDTICKAECFVKSSDFSNNRRRKDASMGKEAQLTGRIDSRRGREEDNAMRFRGGQDARTEHVERGYDDLRIDQGHDRRYIPEYSSRNYRQSDEGSDSLVDQRAATSRNDRSTDNRRDDTETYTYSSKREERRPTEHDVWSDRQTGERKNKSRGDSYEDRQKNMRVRERELGERHDCSDRRSEYGVREDGQRRGREDYADKRRRTASSDEDGQSKPKRHVDR